MSDYPIWLPDESRIEIEYNTELVELNLSDIEIADIAYYDAMARDLAESDGLDSDQVQRSR